MNLLVAPDAFKGSLDAPAAAAAIAAGLRRALPDATLDLMPLGDGGEGTLQALVAGGRARTCTVDAVLQADGARASAQLGLLGGDGDEIVLVEAAEACGWRAGHDAVDVRCASTRGVGELVAAALARRPRRVLVALGGSRTVDGGAGLLQALGATLTDAAGDPLPPGGAALARLASLDLAPARARLGEVELVALCDVTSPLLGPDGARRFMAQKGATHPALQDALEAGLARLVASSDQPGVASLPGAGAAGGLGAALALLGARLVSGIDFVLDALDADARIARAALVVAGEGRIDGQTGAGKVIAGLARRCAAAAVPLVALCGSRADDLEPIHQLGLTAALTILPAPLTLAAATARTAELLEATARELGGIAAWRLVSSGVRG